MHTHISVKEYNRLQMDEMNRYKWIESEKAGYDLGESSLIRWIVEFGSSFRDDMEKRYSSYQN